MKEIRTILLLCALAALWTGEKIYPGQLKTPIPKPNQGTCEYGAYYNYLLAYAYMKNDERKSLEFFEKAKKYPCKIKDVLLQRIQNLDSFKR